MPLAIRTRAGESSAVTPLVFGPQKSVTFTAPDFHSYLRKSSEMTGEMQDMTKLSRNDMTKNSVDSGTKQA
jgi:hypothetical protein